MTRISLSFLVHHPVCLSEFSFFNIGSSKSYTDESSTASQISFLADNCYLKMNHQLLELIDSQPKKFSFSFSISGILLENLKRYRPDVIQSFQHLASSKNVEFLAETFLHSLSFQYNLEEFKHQVQKHSNLILELFGQKPKVFANTSLIYNNALGLELESLGFEAVIAPAVERLLKGMNKHQVLGVPNTHQMKCLLSDIEMANQIVENDQFDFQYYSNDSDLDDNQIVNLSFDYANFIENFPYRNNKWTNLRNFIKLNLDEEGYTFQKPSELLTNNSESKYSVQDFISNEFPNFDLSNWLSNSMQYESLSKIYSLRKQILNKQDTTLIENWSNLLSADYFLAMCTQFGENYQQKTLFNPYRSPYDAYISYMNMISNLELKLKE
jgi:alpha-amylase